MKKLFLFCIVAGLSLTATAQDETPMERHSVSTNSFWGNWFLQANLAGSAFYSNTEAGLGYAKSPLKGFRNNLGLSVALGKWFTPGIGLRTKLTGIWGRSVISTDKDKNANKYWTLHEHVLLNLSNMFYGYSDTRVWNFIPYAGAGIGRNMSYNTYCMGLTAGLLNQFRLSRNVALNLDVSYGVYEPDFDGFVKQGPKVKRSSLTTKDHAFNVEFGITYNIGKATWKKTPDLDAIHALYQSEIDAINAQLADVMVENEQLREEVKRTYEPLDGPGMVKVVPPEPVRVSFFFERGKSDLTDARQTVNLEALINQARVMDANLVVEGYADSDTGDATLNQELSPRRAESVAAELVRLGVPREKLTVVGKGGVNTLTPPEYNRRVIVYAE